MSGVTFPPYRFYTLSEACDLYGLAETDIRDKCRIVRDKNGERVWELELLRQFGITRKTNV